MKAHSLRCSLKIEMNRVYCLLHDLKNFDYKPSTRQMWGSYSMAIIICLLSLSLCLLVLNYLYHDFLLQYACLIRDQFKTGSTKSDKTLRDNSSKRYVFSLHGIKKCKNTRQFFCTLNDCILWFIIDFYKINSRTIIIFTKQCKLILMQYFYHENSKH